ncbi:NAD(P)-dependent dehydrogenase (short-subunit alcohol dehydrogenase family) [Pullulanibacillus pueri]|uniref:Short-chain dehydrogenase/reductase n=1 Tax=Pullulanibacillus pueri TaxID=1437324 RepID=A0A8J3A010_9BACL|nr:SDR family oxidoreductase [Pullulanibacillus pueri]MBM7683455.1 NAD(P)-dependent dehydrogenase (short-subunit alcohol dehydrogenase family) [Pullulanibacillus pueri]GGH87453.1 short-chain dehydrogenase/reductase [Pullulanibacillus pueri]
MNHLRKKVVLITGSSGGFGKRLCASFLREGYSVVATLRDWDKRTEILNALSGETEQEHLHFFELDVTDNGQIRSVITTVIQQFGRIDVLINNAGFASGGYIEEVPMETWQQQIETNVLGLIAVTKAVLPYMRAAQKGTVVNMSSISGQIGFPGLGPYATSKFAIEGFSESLRLEMQPYGIRVIVIEPGAFQTNIWSKGIAAFHVESQSPYKNKSERLLQTVEMIEKKAGDPDDVVQLIVKKVTKDTSTFRASIGRGVKTTLFLKKLLPWHWIEATIIRKTK